MKHKKNIILFDNNWENFLPLTYTRPVCELRIGILTIREKWEKRVSCQISFITQEYLSGKYPIKIENDNYIVNSSIIPNEVLIERIFKLESKQALLYNGELIAVKLGKDEIDVLLNLDEMDELEAIECEDEINIIKIGSLCDVFRLNAVALQEDFDLITKNRTSQVLSRTNTLIGDNIFIEEGASIEGAIINAESPVYVGKNATIMEGSLIRGGLSLGEGSVLKMGAKIYGATTIGPYCKVGGEVNNAILIGYSNKGHDGFLGNSIIGEWCNIGADTNTSNLKNNYSEVKLWNYTTQSFKKTGSQFCGLVMGDHSKCGINTMFNTGTVVGVSANIYGAGYPRNFIPSFIWGGPQGMRSYNFDKAMEVAEIVMNRRDQELSTEDKNILRSVKLLSAKYRTWE